MKFNDGYWLLRQGVTAAYAKEAFAVETSDSTVSIAALTRPVEHRGSHLNTPTITVDLASPAQPTSSRSAPRDGCARRRRRPAFQLHATSSEVAVESDDDHVSLQRRRPDRAGDRRRTLGARLPGRATGARERGSHGPGFHAGGRRPEHAGNVAHDAAPHAAGGDQRLRPGRALRRLREERPVRRHLEPGRRDGQRAGLQVGALLRHRRRLRHLREQPRAGLLRGVLGGRLGHPVLGAGRRARVPRHPRPHPAGDRGEVRRPHRATGAPTPVVVRPVAVDLVPHRLRRGDGHALRRRHAGARDPAQRRPLRLLLDEAAPVV